MGVVTESACNSNFPDASILFKHKLSIDKLQANVMTGIHDVISRIQQNSIRNKRPERNRNHKPDQQNKTFISITVLAYWWLFQLTLFSWNNKSFNQWSQHAAAAYQ